jgi:hypothetical protein
MSKANTNPDHIQYEHRPFYNLAAIRRDLNTLVVRCAHDPEMLEAIKETCDAATALGKARHKSELASRAEIKRQTDLKEAADEARRVEQAKANARAAIVAGEAMIADATAVLGE